MVYLLKNIYMVLGANCAVRIVYIRFVIYECKLNVAIREEEVLVKLILYHVERERGVEFHRAQCG